MSRRILTALALLLICAGAVRATEAWRDADCSYRRAITIDNSNMGSTTLSNFTVLVKITDTHQIDKDKIADGQYTFWDSSGNELDFENEAYSEGANYVNMETWVETQSLNGDGNSATDDTIWIYYSHSGGDQDDGTGAWDADGNWRAVWHLSDSSGGADDSTSNSNDLSESGTVNYSQTGQIADAVDLPGTDDYLSRADDADFDFAAGFSLHAWAEPDATDAATRIFYRYDATSMDGYFLAQSPTHTGYWRFTVLYSPTYDGCYSDAAPTGSWEHVVGVREADGTLKMYCDGSVQADTGSKAGAIDTNGVFYVGCDFVQASDYNGSLDELRVSGTARSADWIAFEHANGGGEADNELTVAAEESKPAAGGAVPQLMHQYRLRRSG